MPCDFAALRASFAGRLCGRLPGRDHRGVAGRGLPVQVYFFIGAHMKKSGTWVGMLTGHRTPFLCVLVTPTFCSTSHGGCSFGFPQKASFEIEIDGQFIGYLNFDLRPDIAPLTCTNFISEPLCEVFLFLIEMRL